MQRETTLTALNKPKGVDKTKIKLKWPTHNGDLSDIAHWHVGFVGQGLQLILEKNKIPKKCNTHWRPMGWGMSTTSLDIKVPNRFNYHQNALFTVLGLFVSLQFKIVSNTFIMHVLVTLLSGGFCSTNPFQLLSGVTVHTLETFFSKFLGISQSFQYVQIVSNVIRMHALETLS